MRRNTHNKKRRPGGHQPSKVQEDPRPDHCFYSPAGREQGRPVVPVVAGDAQACRAAEPALGEAVAVQLEAPKSSIA